jgi:hypothetical protein
MEPTPDEHRSLRRLAAALFAAAAMSAKAAETHPLDVPVRSYAFVLVVALLGGLVSFYAKVKAGSVSAWNLFHLIGELATAAFAGLIAFWLCSYMDAHPFIMAPIVGMAGHMGAKAIALVEMWGQTAVQRKMGGPQ